MAKLITKFKYLKSSARQSVGGYAKYIATREGVEKVDDTFKTDPPTEKQKKLIERILRDFPDSNSMLEYEDYLKEPTLGNASEFITRALEDNAHEALNAKTYADYIAMLRLRDLFSVPVCGSYIETQRNCSTERVTLMIRIPPWIF